MLRLNPTLLLFLLPLAPLCAQETEMVTLPEAVRIAVERHPEVGTAKAAADVLKGKIREVRAQALPEINITDPVV